MIISALNENLAEFIKILSDTSRLDILDALKEGAEMSASEIEDSTGKSQSSTSQQLKNLVNARVLNVRRESRNKYYKIRDAQIFRILTEITIFLSNISQDRIEELSDADISDTLY
jgi:DNA-binding transcriptional ArsR family regulator